MISWTLKCAAVYCVVLVEIWLVVITNSTFYCVVMQAIQKRDTIWKDDGISAPISLQILEEGVVPPSPSDLRLCRCAASSCVTLRLRRCSSNNDVASLQACWMCSRCFPLKFYFSAIIFGSTITSTQNADIMLCRSDVMETVCSGCFEMFSFVWTHQLQTFNGRRLRHSRRQPIAVLELAHIVDPPIIHKLLFDSTNLVVNWVRVRTVAWKPQPLRNKSRSFELPQLDYVTCPYITILIFAGNAEILTTWYGK